MEVIKGYCAVNIGTFKKPKWIGVIQGNIFCKVTHLNANNAINDAETLFNKLVHL